MTGGAVRRYVLLAALTITLAACTPAAAGAAPVEMVLTDMGIQVPDATIAPERVAFEIRNEGKVIHEVEVFANAVRGQVLPVDASVALTDGLALIDEVEDIVPGATTSLVVDLDPGVYLIMCNVPGHYEAGMWTYLTVAKTSE